MAGATDVLAEWLLHGVIATLVVEGLLHWVPVSGPASRFPYRVSALLAPVLIAPVFALATPFRYEGWFQDLSIFVSGRWALLRIGPVDIRTLGLALSVGVALTLLLRDLVRVARDAWEVRQREARLARVDPPPRLREAVSALSVTLGVRQPAVELLAAPHHILHCRGWRHPRIMMSMGTLGDVSDEELRVSIAHELAHIRHHDVGRGWLLLALRALQWFNPLAQAVGRRAAHELEWLADDRAAAATGAPLALAHALVRCARRRGDRFLGLSGLGRLRALEDRCRRLMHRPGPPDTSCRGELVLLWGGLVAIMVFTQ